MTMCKIIRSFNFSRDGVAVERATAGTDCDIPANLVAGLANAGFLAAVLPTAGDVGEAADLTTAAPLAGPGECENPPQMRMRPTKVKTKVAHSRASK